MGIDVDMADMSDLVPTLAAVAVFADTPTTITGVGFIRGKESDRLGDLRRGAAQDRRRCEVTDDGLVVRPRRRLHGAVLATHHDHRLAMAFGVLGTVVRRDRGRRAGRRGEELAGVLDRAGRHARTVTHARCVTTCHDGSSCLQSVRWPRSTSTARSRPVTAWSRSCVRVGGRRRAAAARCTAPAISPPHSLRATATALKALAAHAVFTGRSDRRRRASHGDEFAERSPPEAARRHVARLRWHLEQGTHVVLVSASYAVVPACRRPAARRRRRRRPPSSAVDADGRCTGELEGQLPGTGEGAASPRLAGGALGGSGGRRAWAYGDSAGDRELLADADHPVWAKRLDWSRCADAAP